MQVVQQLAGTFLSVFQHLQNFQSVRITESLENSGVALLFRPVARLLAEWGTDVSVGFSLSVLSVYLTH